MADETVRVGVANEGEITISSSILETWTPKNITQIGDTVFFKQEDTFYSMKVVDFRKLYQS